MQLWKRLVVYLNIKIDWRSTINNRPTTQTHRMITQPAKQTKPTKWPANKQGERIINQTSNQITNKQTDQRDQPDQSTNCPVIQTRRQINQPGNQPEKSQLSQWTIGVLKWSIKRELEDLKFLLKGITLLTKWDPTCFNSTVSFGPTLPKRLSWERWRKTERKVGK